MAQIMNFGLLDEPSTQSVTAVSTQSVTAESGTHKRSE